MIFHQLMNIWIGILLVLLPSVSSGVGYKHGLTLKNSLLQEKAVCMSRCLNIENDQWRMKCEETCDELSIGTSTSTPTCPQGEFYDPDYEECDDCDSICLNIDTEELCDVYCPDYAVYDYDDDDYYNDDVYDDDDYEDAYGDFEDNDDNLNDESTSKKKSESGDKEGYPNSRETDRFKLETQREETDYDENDYDDLYPEEDTFKHTNDGDPVVDDADNTETHKEDKESEDFEEIGSADTGSGNLDDELETTDTDADATNMDNGAETSQDNESSEMWFDTTSDNETSSNKILNINSSLPVDPLPYSELKSNDDTKSEASPSVLLYIGVFVAGAFVAFIMSIVALSFWRPFGNNIKRLLKGKKDSSCQLLPYRSPIVRNGPETFMTERESFL